MSGPGRSEPVAVGASPAGVRLPVPGPAQVTPWDFQPIEVASGALAAFIVLLGTYLAFELANTAVLDAPQIDKGAELPIRVIPMLDDLPLLKLGGKQKAVLPDAWVKKTPQKLEEKQTFASTKAEKVVDAVPPKDQKVAEPDTKPPDPDAELVKSQETQVDEDPDAKEQNFAQEGHAAGDERGTEVDPLKARAVDQYRARVAGFFSSRFRVGGSGLPEEQLLAVRVSAVVQLSGLTVTGFSVNPSGNAAFDGAAQSALSSVVGSQIPPPPENYPDLGVGASFGVTFYCVKGRCD